MISLSPSFTIQLRERERKKLCSYMSIDRFDAIKMKLNTIHLYIGNDKEKTNEWINKAKQQETRTNQFQLHIRIVHLANSCAISFPSQHYTSFSSIPLVRFFRLSLYFCFSRFRGWMLHEYAVQKMKVQTYVRYSQEICLLAINAVSTFVFEPHKQYDIIFFPSSWYITGFADVWEEIFFKLKDTRMDAVLVKKWNSNRRAGIT